MGRFKQALGRFMTGERAIRLNAALVIREMRERLGVTLSYDEKSVTWLDDYITSLRPNLTQETKDRLVSVLGSFFGEVVRHRYGGEWRQVEGQWAIAFDEKNMVFPFRNVLKHLEGEDHPLLGVCRSIPVVFKDVLGGDRVGRLRPEEPSRLLETLQDHEARARKYRVKGDAYYDLGNESLCMAYHNDAAAEEQKAREIVAGLERALGPAGATDPPAPEEREMIVLLADALPDPWRDERGGFEDACFFARYPKWASLVPRLSQAYDQWKKDPRFLREAPRFRPVHPEWIP